MANIRKVCLRRSRPSRKRTLTGFSKLYAEAKTYKDQGAVIDNTALTEANILDWFDEQMAVMDDQAVPEDGRRLYVTPAVRKILKGGGRSYPYLKRGGGGRH